MRRILQLHDEPIPEGAVRFLSWMLGVFAFVRGLDYWRSDGGTESLKIIELIAPLSTWGVALMVVAVVLVGGMAIRIHEVVWLGHTVLAGIYFMLTIATAQAVVPAGTGYRGVGPLATITVLHTLLAVVRGPIPKGTRK